MAEHKQTNNTKPNDNSLTTEEVSIKAAKSDVSIAITKNTKILALFAIACTLVVGIVNGLTKERIKKQEQRQLIKTLSSIIDSKRFDNDIANDCILIKPDELASGQLQKAYIARKSDKLIAVAITNTAPEGYNGNINFIVAINADNSISGVRVLKHQETPGLGDKIEVRKSDWIHFFTGKSLSNDNDNRWAVKKDGGMFDQFTGATITPRALVNGVKDTLSYFIKNKDNLLSRENACKIEQSAQGAEMANIEPISVLMPEQGSQDKSTQDTGENTPMQITDIKPVSTIESPVQKPVETSAATKATKPLPSSEKAQDKGVANEQ